MPIHTCDVIVLGGGPAGVATALETAERGLQVVLLERADTTGGMAGSFDVDGVRVDHGSHRLHPVTPPEVMHRLTALLGEDLQLRPRRGRLRLLDRWVDFPLRPADLARSMPPRWLARVAADTATGPLRARRRSRSPGRHSYAASLRASLGPTVYESLYAPYAQKLWGLPGMAIDPEQARVRVGADTVPKVAARVLRAGARRLASGASAPGATFYYPRRGFGQITHALDAAAREAGAEIRTGSVVTAVRGGRDDDGFEGVEVWTDDGSCWRAPRVFSTLPIPLLARLTEPSPPERVVADARRLRFRATVLVYLTHRAEPVHPASSGEPGADPPEPVRWSGYDAHYLPGPGTPITRISEPANYRDSAEDPSDHSVICAEIPCTIGDELWTAREGELAQIVHRAIADFDLPPLQAGAVAVRHLPSVYPIYEHGFSQRLARLEAWADELPGVTTLGRSGLFAHDNTHHGLLMAQAAAGALGPDGGFDEDQWRRSRESFRAHVVED